MLLFALAKGDPVRYGISEWYGRPLATLQAVERVRYAELQARKVDRNLIPACPFRSTERQQMPCTKAGGVCSLRQYKLEANGAASFPVGSKPSITCPNRFLQNRFIFEWIGRTILDIADPVIASEVGFLERQEEKATDAREDVGRIDQVLVHPTADPMRWCALEIQAVYFSGRSMSAEFQMLRQSSSDVLPFPAGQRRPDFRSSGPKRLMPQLQIKVPSLRRWGKKMAVVVDEAFFEACGRMDEVAHVSNSDIAWFVVGFDESAPDPVLKPSFVRLTTLEHSVEGLTGGAPVSLPEFEARIRSKIAPRSSQATPDLSR